MTRFRLLLLTAAVAALLAVQSRTARGEEPRSRKPPEHAERSEIEAIVKDYLAKHPEEVQRIVKDYLIKHPEVLQEAFTELLRRRTPDKSAVVKNHARALFYSPHHVTLGNPQGDVTIVEFVDYNCGYCKRALADMLELIKTDPKLRVVLKEHPVLGASSVEAARVAVAVRMQDQTGVKYLEFHRRLLEASGPANKARAMAVAIEIGLDAARLETDMAGQEAGATLAESASLAQALGIRGTPSYVIGDDVVFGAVGIAVLRDKIAATRKR